MTSPAVVQLVQAANAGSNPALSPDERKHAIAVLFQPASGVYVPAVVGIRQFHGGAAHI